MSNEIRNNETRIKAVELSDNEMDHIAGGHVAVLQTGNLDNMGVQICHWIGVTADMFVQSLKSSTPCVYYQRRPESYITGPDGCGVCIYNEHTESNLYSIGTIKDVYLKKGYDVLINP